MAFRFVSAVLLLATVATAQLSFRNDPSQNSFQIQTPGFQQSFTRYFNGQQGSLFAAQQQQQQQQPQQSQPQYAPLPQTYHGNYYGQQQQAQQLQQQQPYSRFTSQFGAAQTGAEPQYTTVQDNYINPNIRLAIQQQRLQQQQQLQQQQYQPQQPQQQQQYYSQEDIAAYLQSQQVAQAQYYPQQPQQPQANPQSQYEYIQQQQQALQQQQQQQQYDASQQQQQQQQQQQDPSAATDAQATHNKLIGVAFSPSNEVSQVKFNGNGLKYNF
nr:putative uncharacterized protein DDB_G0271606 [Aedes albopictus]